MSSTPAAANLAGAAAAWRDAPEWMDFLRPDSPAHRHKLAERELYLRLWEPFVSPGARVLDAGGGIGRFSMWCLDRGCQVDLVDPDPRSLGCAWSHAAGRPGRLTTVEAPVEAMPVAGPYDVVIAAELLCYVQDPALALAALVERLRPGGVLLVSVEARWGWAVALDAPAGHLDAVFGDGVLHAPGDRFVRTFEERAFRALLGGLVVERFEPSHYLYSGPLQQVAGEVDLDALFAWEARAKAHPVFGPLNRAWIAVARRG